MWKKFHLFKEEWWMFMMDNTDVNCYVLENLIIHMNANGNFVKKIVFHNQTL